LNIIWCDRLRRRRIVYGPAVTVLKGAAVMKLSGAGLGVLLQALLMPSGAQAAELPVTRLTVMGSLGGTAQYRDIEEPFWSHQLSADSGGRITAKAAAQ
jgi:hypothetical protein